MDVDCDVGDLLSLGRLFAACHEGQRVAVAPAEQFALVAAPAAPPAAGAVDPHVQEDLQELALLGAIGAVVPHQANRKFQRRSWQHALNASREWSRLCIQRKLDDAQGQLKKAKTQLAVVAASFPAAQKILGVRAHELKRYLSGEGGEQTLAQVTMHLAVVGSTGSSSAKSSSQIRAIARAARCIRSVMADRVQALVMPVHPVVGEYRVVVICYQWDETLQSLRSLVGSAPSTRGAPQRSSTASSKVQTMVQSAVVTEFTYADPAQEATTVYGVPWICRPMFLWRQTANHILEALFRSYPVDLSDRARVAAMSQLSDAVVLVFLRDGASANGLAIKHILSVICQQGFPNILPFSQLCCLHLCAIARTR
eukprot:6511502-Pyramimonas_sp.AAC.1